MNHILEIPSYLGKIFPVSCLVASLFSINKLKNRNELTAIFASGYSRKRYITDLFHASIFVMILQFLNLSFVGPFLKANRDSLITNSQSKFRNLKSKGLRANTIGSGSIWYKGDDYFFSFLSFDKKNLTINNASLYYFNTDQLLKKKITAKKIILKEKTWIGFDVNILSNLHNSSFPLSQDFKSKTIPINETTEDFSQIESDITTLNIFELKSYINQLDNAGININEYLVLFLDKFASSILCIIFTLLASVSVFKPNRREEGFGKNLAFVFIFTIFYWLVYSYLFELGKNSIIHPAVACFSVPVVFSLFLVFFFYKNRKLH